MLLRAVALAVGASAGASTLVLLGGAMRLGQAAVGAPPNATVFIVMMASAAGLEGGLSALRADAGAPSEGSWPTWLAAATGLVLLLASTLPLLAGALARPQLFIGLGASAMGVGAALRAGAIAQLGERFNSSNAIAEGAGLEQHALYRRLAHPSELGLLLLVAGGLVLVGRPAAWLFLPLVYLLTLARVRLEEQALTRRHGDNYRRYRARTLDPAPAFTGETAGP
jgi:protein-S-isoprenylcysteine O-methyltransferase Ste14